VLEGKQKQETLDYPEQEYFYYTCAKEFGWTITETDEQPAALVDWLISIHSVVRQIENDNQ
jgi:hypothetical protein